MGSKIPDSMLHRLKQPEFVEKVPDFKQIPGGDFPQEFLHWLRTAEAEGLLSPCLELIRQRYGITNFKQVIRRLYELISQNIGKITVSSRDLRYSSSTSFRPLRNVLGKAENESGVKQVNLPWQLGTIGHQSIEFLLSSPELRDPKFLNNGIPQGLQDKQLFLDLGIKGLELFFIKESSFIPPGIMFDLRSELVKWEKLDWNSLLLLPEQITSRQRDEIAILWQALSNLVRTPGIWLQNYEEAQKLFCMLNRVLLPVFRPFLWRALCLPEQDLRDRYLKILTILSWAKMALYCEHSSFVMSEVLLLPKKGNPYRKIDGLRLGRESGKQEKAVLLELLNRYSSKGKLTAGKILASLGDKSEIEILEFKFGVGDGFFQWDILTQDNLPLSRHNDQLKFYATFASVDHWIEKQRQRTKRENIDWTKGPKETFLMYLLPFDDGVKVFQNEMEPAEKMRYFSEMAQQWEIGEYRAYMREANKALTRVIEGQKGRKEEARIFLPPAGNQYILPFPLHQTEFPLLQQRLRGVPELIRDALSNGAHQWFDENQVVSVNLLGEKVLHLDRLSELVAAGIIQVGRFSLPRGGHISCPIHQDPNPSMFLYLKEGQFHCFGCGAHGTIIGTFTFENGNQVVPGAMKRTARLVQRVEELEVPGNHHLVMAVAQFFLQKNFKGSRGEVYIKEERCLEIDNNPYAGEIGFGNNKVAMQIFDALTKDSSLDSKQERLKETFNKLLFYGFFAFFESQNPRDGLTSLLLRRGLKLEDVAKKVRTDEKGASVYQVPYFVLANRVTLPLGFEPPGILNFYGRNIGEQGLKHRKLSTDQTELPHGAFLMELTKDSARKVLYITEGVMDAFSLYEITGEPALALIGADNVLAVQTIARWFKGQTIYIALDYDIKSQAGQINAPKIERRLRANGFQGEIVNFTNQFIEKHPEFLEKGCKDFNEYLIRCVKQK